MKKIDLKLDAGKVFKKIPLKRVIEILLLVMFIATAGFSIWLWFDIEKKTSNENIPESKLIPDDKMNEFRKIKSSFDDKTKEDIEEEGTMPRNSFY